MLFLALMLLHSTHSCCYHYSLHLHIIFLSPPPLLTGAMAIVTIDRHIHCRMPVLEKKCNISSCLEWRVCSVTSLSAVLLTTLAHLSLLRKNNSSHSRTLLTSIRRIHSSSSIYQPIEAQRDDGGSQSNPF